MTELGVGVLEKQNSLPCWVSGLRNIKIEKNVEDEQIEIGNESH